MLRIALAVQDFPPQPGGTPVYNLEYARRLAGQGHRVRVFAWSSGPDSAPALPAEPFELVRVDARRTRSGLDPAPLARGLASEPCDVVLVSGSNAAMGGAASAAARHAPVAIAVHDVRDKGRGRGRLRRWRSRQRYGFDAATRLLPVSLHNRDCLLRLGVPAEKIRVVHPGVDTHHFTPDPGAGAALRRTLGLESRQILLTVSRIAPNKGHASVIEALALLQGRLPGLLYVVVGEGGLRGPLEALAARRGVAHRVRFVGPVEDSRPWYHACDLYVMPSTPRSGGLRAGEGFGIAYLEAAACGKPAVASSSGGGAEIVVDGETGRVVPPDDPARLAAALEELLGDPERLRARGERARGRSLGFDWSRGALALERALLETAGLA